MNAIFVVMHLAAVYAADVRPDSAPTAADITAGYRQNRLRFSTLRVTWRRQFLYHENRVKSYERAGTFSAEQIALQTKPVEFHQQFRTDRKGFQIRAPMPMGEGVDLDSKYVFPTVPLTEETYIPHFGNLTTITSDGRSESGIRAWSGFRFGHGQGVIFSALPTGYKEAAFPPLAVERAVDGFDAHPYDVLFFGAPDGLEVVGREKLQGYDCYLVERQVESLELAKSWTTAKPWAKYRSGLRVFARQRAWIDGAHGFVPMRLETRHYFTYDGRRYDDPWGLGADSVVTTTAIRDVSNGGVYPIQSEQVFFAMDVTDDRGFPGVGAVIDGAVDVKRRAARTYEVRWICDEVVAGEDMAGVFSVSFPDNTVYWDQRTSKAHGLAANPEAVMNSVLAATRRDGELPRPWYSRPRVLSWIAVPLFGAVAALLLWCRRRASASANGHV